MSGLMRFAAIADVHGNRWALEAVLADIEARGIQTLINLGDGPLDPHGTAALLAQIDALRIQGNCDRLLLETDAVDPSSTLALNRGLLTDDERK
jgi:predicted phosphodiesterase